MVKSIVDSGSARPASLELPGRLGSGLGTLQGVDALRAAGHHGGRRDVRKGQP